MHSAIYTGQLEHRRFVPRRHRFTYRVSLFWLDLSELDEVFRERWLWSARRPAIARFRRADYLGDPRQPLADAVRDCVARECGRRPAGPIRLLTRLRQFGHNFNPVSFYYCYDAQDRQLEFIVAEITNTPWNERHAYVLDVAAAHPPAARSLRFRFDKSFHVSPFMPMDMAYDWRFSVPGAHALVHMRNLRSGERQFDATLRLKRREITAAALAGTLLRFPFSSLSVLIAIYWQALRLLMKRAPFHSHPHTGLEDRPRWANPR